MKLLVIYSIGKYFHRELIVKLVEEHLSFLIIYKNAFGKSSIFGMEYQ